jgi:hypothetical protein
MKTLVILSGGAGFGKTHMMNYIERTYISTISLTTGDYHKIKYGLGCLASQRFPELPPVLLGEDALQRYIFDNRDLGLAAYEARKKHDTEQTNREIIRFIESDRGVVPDFPSRAMLKLAACAPDNVVVTDVINLEELKYLLDLVAIDGNYSHVYVAKLICKDPHQGHAAVTQNRQEVEVSDILTSLTEAFTGSDYEGTWATHIYPYELMQSEDTADEIMTRSLLSEPDSIL